MSLEVKWRLGAVPQAYELNAQYDLIPNMTLFAAIRFILNYAELPKTFLSRGLEIF